MYLINIIKYLPSRILSAILDQISLVISAIIIFSIGDGLASSSQETNKIELIMAIILFSIVLNKDIYFGKSIGKHFNGLRVVSARTGNPASPIQCLARNLFLLVWPLEALILFFSPKRRIGDFVAGTKVLESTETNREKKWPYFQAIISVVCSFILIYYLFNFINSLGIMN